MVIQGNVGVVGVVGVVYFWLNLSDTAQRCVSSSVLVTFSLHRLSTDPFDATIHNWGRETEIAMDRPIEGLAMDSIVPAQPIDRHEPEGLKDTLESIVIAMILALVFRAFIIEAFVIPTGSMAPTLYGAHGTILCEDCGVEFAYGVKDLADTRRIRPVRNQSRAICPNCNHANTNLPISDEKYNADKGDRILVMKWPLDMGIAALEPKRWEVTVFKDPADGSTNFIKRLVGMPGEVLMIVDGDVYTVPLQELSKRALTDLEQVRHEKYLFRTKQKFGQLRSLSKVVMAELDQKMRVTRKSQSAQQNLWHLVYDHDYPPQTLGLQQPYWAVMAGDQSGWNTSTRRVKFTDQGLPDDHIVLTGKDIRATCAYNIHANIAQPVTDLRLGFVLTPETDRGVLRVRLDKWGRSFWASINLDGTITLSESIEIPNAITPIMARAKVESFTPGESIEISFELVDYRLAIRVRDEEVLASSDDEDSSAYYAPNLNRLRHQRSRRGAPPRIYGEGGSWSLTHLIVQRDEHYYHDTGMRSLRYSWAPRLGWASPDDPILLRSHEYFMLGDNTAASKDSRLWDQVATQMEARGEEFQVGTVPRDQLIGQAFFVYWPSGHSLPLLPSVGSWRWKMIPDVGRMRWIR